MKHKIPKIVDNNVKPNFCIKCNPKKYLTFNFSYISYESSRGPAHQDIVKLWERMKWMSSDTVYAMVHNYGSDKARWFEDINITQIRKSVPSKFRDDFPTETNEKYSVMRVYSAGTPSGTANPRIIGMIKHTTFYVFFLDWEGKLYNHGK